MTVIDQDNLIVSWNPDMTLIKKQTYDLQLIEHSSFDVDTATLKRTFTLSVVSKYDTFLDGGETKIIDLSSTDTYCLPVTYECWSKRCPNFIWL